MNTRPNGFSFAGMCCLMVSLIGCSQPQPKEAVVHGHVDLKSLKSRVEAPQAKPGESRFSGLRQLSTGGGVSAARIDPRGGSLMLEARKEGFVCGQVFQMNLDGSNGQLVSTGVGQAAIGGFGVGELFFSSTHGGSKVCPASRKPDGGQIVLAENQEIYRVGLGKAPVVLAGSIGFDGQVALSAAADLVVFTSTRGGDVDLWSMAPDGSQLTQLTREEGYDGNAAISADGKQIVYQAYHPGPEDVEAYRQALSRGEVDLSRSALWIMNVDGTEKRRLVSNGASNVHPAFHPTSSIIIFASNMDSAIRGNAAGSDLFIISTDGTGLERITYGGAFDGSPGFSGDGRSLVFVSDRHSKKEGERNVFVAEWGDGLRSSSLGESLSAERWLAGATELSSDKFAGRGLGSPGLKLAAKWVESEFQKAGLEPGADKGFRQVFEAATGAEVIRSSLKIGGKEGGTPLSYSASGRLEEGEVYFVGYGISSAQARYDDYEGIDVEGKVVVMFRYEPDRWGENERFAGRAPLYESAIRAKAVNARHHGAKAVIVINPPPMNSESDAAPSATSGTADVGIPVFHMTWKVAQTRFGPGIEGWRQSIDEKRVPASAPLSATVSMDVELRRVYSPAVNIVGVLRAGETPTSEALVIGAHYDHLGRGGEGSRSPKMAIHPGADDNASGVAMLLELARGLSGAPLKRDVYVVAFTGEETGLLGSSWAIANPPWGSARAIAMLNLDMVGRLNGQALTVFGVGTAKEFVDALREVQADIKMPLELNGDGYGASDHMPFYAAGVPVLAFFSGLHAEYHTPDDTADKLDAAGAARIARFVLGVAVDFAGTREVSYVPSQSVSN